MPPPPTASEETIRTLARDEWGRLLSALIGTVRDFQLAEDSLQDAVESALMHWGRDGLPRSPAGWLLQTARRKAIDRIRRDRNFEKKSAEYARLIDIEQDAIEPPEPHAIPDERLSLMFACCHPAIEEKSRIALTLRTLGGLTTREIARAFLDSEEAMAQRLVRAKHKIAKAGIPFVVPDLGALPDRLASVLGVIYLIFNEGYASSVSETAVRVSLTDEAVRLARILHALRSDEPETAGLLALMLLHDSRRDARTDAVGDLVLLEQQDRSLWRHAMIDEALPLLESALQRGRIGPYQLQAAISAVHAEAPSLAATRWHEIVALYDLLLHMQPNPVIRLNRAVAVSYARGPAEALTELAHLSGPLDGYQPLHAAFADCLARTGCREVAATHYAKAIDLTSNARERAFLIRQLQGL
jgi:RNA polymerase sigma-70 factor (ECF subfamily)